MLVQDEALGLWQLWPLKLHDVTSQSTTSVKGGLAETYKMVLMPATRDLTFSANGNHMIYLNEH
jgi:hypothetical protein